MVQTLFLSCSWGFPHGVLSLPSLEPLPTTTALKAASFFAVLERIKPFFPASVKFPFVFRPFGQCRFVSTHPSHISTHNFEVKKEDRRDSEETFLLLFLSSILFLVRRECHLFLAKLCFFTVC